jgi:hypothetical protein
MNRDDQEFTETLELLREAHREAIPEAHFAAVRARVLAQLAAERRPWWRGIRAYGFAAAAVAAMLLAAFWPKHVVQRQTVGRMLPPASRMVEQAGHAGPPPVLQPVAVRRIPGKRRRPPHNAASAVYRVVGPPDPRPLVVKLITDDPNIVIYWIANIKGE